MTCSAVVLICPVKDEAGRQFFCLEFPPVPLSQAPLFFYPSSGFYEAGVSCVVGAVSTANQLLKVATSVPCRKEVGDVLPNRAPSYLFNGLTA